MSITYLYGAAVQGIQNFIFQTNKLKEIVGASELVEEICTSLFKEFYNEIPGAELIIGAAGNIKCIFSKKEDCEKAVFEFPQKVLSAAPGITISQAVVEIDDNNTFEEAIEKLEHKLRIQRNIPMRPTQQGALGIERSQQTGLPSSVVSIENVKEKVSIDESTLNKLYRKDLKENLWRKNTTLDLSKKFFDDESLKHKNLPYDIKEITGHNDWIAIIHADGNGLGQVVQKVGQDKDNFKKFSYNLNRATVEAANLAVKETLGNKEYDTLPMRPVVLGGDDLTVICKADMAIDFTENFLGHFETKTKEYLGQILKDNTVFPDNEDYLTACAGIAFIKSGYPFYYGYDLAEELCGEAKKVAKKAKGEGKLAASCLMFHKVQDSFVRNYSNNIERELSITEDKSWKFGPYYLKSQDNFWSINEIKNTVKDLNKENNSSIKSSVRKWISAMHENSALATQQLDRAKDILKEKGKGDNNLLRTLTSAIERDSCYFYPAFDVLALYSIMYQQTK